MRQKSVFMVMIVALLAMMIAPGAASATGSADVIRPPGTVQPQPFAAVPFPKLVAPLLKVSNGWIEADDEKAAIGNSDFHAALDFDGVPCWTPVLAAADGVAVATYQSGIERGGLLPWDPNDPYNVDRDWKDPVTGRTGWLGFAGLVVELQTNTPVPGYQNAVLQYFHLNAVNPSITWLAPDRDPDTVTWDGKHVQNWTPGAIRQSQADIRKIATPVKKGDILGWLGDVGINFGYNDAFDPRTHLVYPRDRKAKPPWDPQGAGVTTPLILACQLHLEGYSGRDAGFGKVGRFDPLDLYAHITGVPGTSSYNNPYGRPGKLKGGPSPIFKRQPNGDFVFAG